MKQKYFIRKVKSAREGLPLAILTLGGLLASEKGKREKRKMECEWRKVHNSYNWELRVFGGKI